MGIRNDPGSFTNQAAQRACAVYNIAAGRRSIDCSTEGTGKATEVIRGATAVDLYGSRGVNDGFFIAVSANYSAITDQTASLTSVRRPPEATRELRMA